MSQRLQFIVVVLLLHLPLYAYPILRLCYWTNLGPGLTTAIFVPLFFSQIVVRSVLRQSNTGLVFWLRRAADLWLGVSPLLLCMLLLAEVPVALGWLAAPVAAYAIIALTCALTLYSVGNAYSPSVVRIGLNGDKITDTLRFVQITDVHIGSRSSAFLRRVIDTVNTLDADFLCITGDFIDAAGIGEERLAALRDCQLPIYLTIGNHERYEDVEHIVARLRRLGVTVLRSDTAIQGQVQLIGVDDSERRSQVRCELAHIAIDRSRYVLLLYHRPHGLADAAEAGVDLMISGHTHNGQIVPFNLIVRKVFEQTVGLFRHGQTHLYVSPGTGTWGPVMRLGSRGEVTLFVITPRAPLNNGNALRHYSEVPWLHTR